MIYFTSDLHIGHKNIINLCNRPFKTVEEMNNTLVNNINSIVMPEDELFILGDITLYKRDLAINILKRINCKNIYIIYGNHDKDFQSVPHNERKEAFKWCKDYYKFYAENRHFVLFHYPIVSWDGRYRNSIHLHGHAHNKASYNLKNKQKNILRYDVGVDANNFKPVSIAQILSFFKGVENNAEDTREEEGRND